MFQPAVAAAIVSSAVSDARSRRRGRHAVGAVSPRLVTTPGLHIEIEGDGPTVLLMHGFGGSARNFGPQARALRDRYRVVRFDARGHARSDAPDEPRAYRPEAFVADVARVLDVAGAAVAVVGGLSMGAAIALRFAL